MSPQDYVEQNGFKPLSDAEIASKQSLRIYNTDELMPWDEVYTRIAAGMSMEHIAEIYGHGRKIALFAIRDGITYNETIANVLDSEIEQRRKMDAIQEQNPVVAQTIHEMANEYAPDVAKLAVLASKELIEKSRKIIAQEEVTSNDLLNIAKAIQTTTDTLEITKRHSAQVQVTNNEIKIEGFTFVEDLPLAKACDELPLIEVEVD